jgi:hypothetical protein
MGSHHEMGPDSPYMGRASCQGHDEGDQELHLAKMLSKTDTSKSDPRRTSSLRTGHCHSYLSSSRQLP